MTNTISALALRSRLGQTLKLIEKERRSFVVEKRGSPKAVILSIADYINLVASEPKWLKKIGESSKRKGTNKLTTKQIDKIIASARNDASHN